jgi:two-component system LytT family response regulator
MSRQLEPLRVVIADDEPLARRRLRSLLAQEADIGVIVETANGPDTIDVVCDSFTDVLFLDVRLPGVDGLVVLEAIGPDAVGVVVFVTAFQDYAVAEFSHHALDYVLKPVGGDRFRATLAWVRERLLQQRSVRLNEEALRTLAQEVHREQIAGEPYLTRLVVRTAQKRVIVEVSDIDWVEARGDYLALHAAGEVYIHRGTLNSLAQRLDPAEFVRIHRSTLVRLSRVKQLEPYFHGDYLLTLRDGTRLRLSRTYRARAEAALGQGWPSRLERK